MDDELNVTYITLGGYVEVDKYRYVYFVILSIVYFLIICSNSTIVYLIVIHKNLHEPMYIFIAALLINSVLFSTAVYQSFWLTFYLKNRSYLIQPVSSNFMYFTL